jgi:hypothetical protein
MNDAEPPIARPIPCNLTRCPICNSEAAEIDRGLFEGMGFDCKPLIVKFRNTRAYARASLKSRGSNIIPIHRSLLGFVCCTRK